MEFLKSFKAKGADAELLTVPLTFGMVLILLMLGSLYSGSEFTAERNSIQVEKLDKYESYATTAALTKNKSLMNNLITLTYRKDQDNIKAARAGIQNALSEERYNPAYRVTLRRLEENRDEELFRIENRQENFRYSELYVASPKKTQHSITVGMKR